MNKINKVMKTPKLLADMRPDPKTGKCRRESRLGKLLHGFSKYMMRAAIDRIYNRMQLVIEYKHKNGWINPEMKLFYDDLTWVINLDRAGPKAKELAHNIRMLEHLRDIICVTLDEDTFYLIRFWVLMHRIHVERWDEHYSIAMNRADAYFKFEEIYKNMRLRNEKLPRLD